MHYAIHKHPYVASCPIGFRTADEVDQILDAVLTPISVMEEFEATFDAEVLALPRSAHWFYDKTTSDIGN